jgi:hypothetical protein
VSFLNASSSDSHLVIRSKAPLELQFTSPLFRSLEKTSMLASLSQLLQHHCTLMVLGSVLWLELQPAKSSVAESYME